MTALLLAATALGTPSTLHPAVMLKDVNGDSVVESGLPVSPMASCSSCHDTQWIEQHSFHATVGVDQTIEPGEVAPSGRPWDTSPGLYGRWNPLVGLNASGMDAEQFTHDFGALHAGGGPGATEMNCFLCHLHGADNDARLAEIEAGHPEWAATATLKGTGILQKGALIPPTEEGAEPTYADTGWRYNTDMFAPDLRVALPLQDPDDEACGQCHAQVHTSTSPLELDPESMGVRSTGQVFAWQRISKSAVNVRGRDDLDRAWDIHAERMLGCTDCHHALNNPAYYFESSFTRPNYLKFDGRRLETFEYLHRPNHDFAKGYSSQGHVADALDGSMRSCEDCHDARATHEWLPFKQRHFESLACESCHIPEVYAPAVASIDYTLVNLDGTPVQRWRGVEGDPADPESLVTGWRPVLLPRTEIEGVAPKLTPHNLITSTVWVAGDPARPLTAAEVHAVLAPEGAWVPGVLAALDSDGDGDLAPGELQLDTPEKKNAIQGLLAEAGYTDAVFRAEIEAYSVHHGVAAGEYAARDCEDCHSGQGRFSISMPLSPSVPQGVDAVLTDDARITLDGDLEHGDDGLTYVQDVKKAGFYVLGESNWRFVDVFGILAFFGTLFGVGGHGLLRFLTTMRRRREDS